MCRACQDTPDGAPRRCNRSDGFSPVESEQRNRVRNLRSASEALAAGDPQAAANALAAAIAADRRLTGFNPVPVAEPSASEQPHLDVVLSPSEVDRFEAQFEALNRKRVAEGRGRLGVEVTRQRRPVEGDPVLAWEQATVRVTGSREDIDRLGFSSNARTEPEKRAKTHEVLAAACAAVRQSGGQYVPRSDAGEGSTPGLVDAYVADAPGGPARARLEPTEVDRAMAVDVRRWARQQDPSSEYVRALRHAVADEYVSMREVGTAASAVAGYLRYRTAAATPRESGGSVTPIRQRPRRSRWLARPGEKVFITGEVVRADPLRIRERLDPHFLYVFRTPDGDLVKWIASSTQGLEVGNFVSLRGTVKAHGEFGGERQTEMHYCTPRIHPRTA